MCLNYSGSKNVVKALKINRNPQNSNFYQIKADNYPVIKFIDSCKDSNRNIGDEVIYAHEPNGEVSSSVNLAPSICDTKN